jgi:predicted nucleic acid-binding protein
MKRKKNNMIVVVDSDALIALFHKTDVNAEKAVKLFETMYEQKAQLIYPLTTLVETVDTLQRKMKNDKAAAKIVELIREAYFSKESIEQVSYEQFLRAAELFKQGYSHRTTLADAVVASVAKTHNADAIFSFDGWYKKQGFTLVADL